MRLDKLQLCAVILLLQSCQQPLPELQEVKLLEGAVRVDLPESWAISKPLPVFGPDCSCCSGGEYGRAIGDGKDTCLFVGSTVYPCKANKFRPLGPKDLKAASVKDPQAILVDTLSDNHRKLTAIGQFAVRRGKKVYRKTIRIAGRHRAVDFSLVGEQSDQTRSLFQRIQESIRVDSVYLN